MIAFVSSVTASVTRSGSMLRSESRTSTNTGAAPQWTTTFAVAGQVIGLVITSSPGPTPRATSDRCSAAVPEDTASTCSTSRYWESRCSSSAARGPVVSQPERIASATASISPSPSAGGWKPMVLDESRIGLEAYESGRRPRPLVGLCPTLAHRKHGARAVGADAELAETEARAPVETHPHDSVRALRLLHSFQAEKLPGRWNEEGRTRTADQRLRCGSRNLLAECRGKGQVVEVDAQRCFAELGVVAAAESGRELHHFWAVRPDPELCIRRAVPDPECVGRTPCDVDYGVGIRLGRPDMRQRHPEGRGLGRDPVGDGERVEGPVGGERVHGHLRAIDHLLDHCGAVARSGNRSTDGRRKLLLVPNDAEAALALAVRSLDDAWKRQGFVGPEHDPPARLRDA